MKRDVSKACDNWAAKGWPEFCQQDRDSNWSDDQTNVKLMKQCKFRECLCKHNEWLQGNNWETDDQKATNIDDNNSGSDNRTTTEQAVITKDNPVTTDEIRLCSKQATSTANVNISTESPVIVISTTETTTMNSTISTNITEIFSVKATDPQTTNQTSIDLDDENYCIDGLCIEFCSDGMLISATTSFFLLSLLI